LNPRVGAPLLCLHLYILSPMIDDMMNADLNSLMMQSYWFLSRDCGKCTFHDWRARHSSQRPCSSHWLYLL